MSTINEQQIEPGAHELPSNTPTDITLLYSCAISLKRIADFLESDKLAKTVFDPFAPSNSYGEGLVDGIQNAIERGQRGINTHG